MRPLEREDEQPDEQRPVRVEVGDRDGQGEDHDRGERGEHVGAEDVVAAARAGAVPPRCAYHSITASSRLATPSVTAYSMTVIGRSL